MGQREYSTNSIVRFLWQIHVNFKMSFLSILSYWVFTWSRKAWTISEFWWLLSGTKLCIYNPSIFLFRDNDSSWSMSKWSVSLQWSNRVKRNASPFRFRWSENSVPISQKELDIWPTFAVLVLQYWARSFHYDHSYTRYSWNPIRFHQYDVITRSHMVSV